MIRTLRLAGCALPENESAYSARSAVKAPAKGPKAFTKRYHSSYTTCPIYVSLGV